jgi:chaperonin GroES
MSLTEHEREVYNRTFDDYAIARAKKFWNNWSELMKSETKQKVKFHPQGEYLLVRPDDARDRTPGGVVLPESVREQAGFKVVRGTVVEVGTGAADAQGKPLYDRDGERIPLTVKRGDRIIYTLYGHTEVDVDGIELLLVKESNVFAVIEGEDELG